MVARMPRWDERREMQLDEGVPVLEIRHSKGKVEVYPGDQVELTRPKMG